MHTEEPLYIREDKMTEENVGIEEAPKCKQTSNKDSYYSQNSRRESVTQVHKKKKNADSSSVCMKYQLPSLCCL